jgi:hypothetical protein
VHSIPDQRCGGRARVNFTSTLTPTRTALPSFMGVASLAAVLTLEPAGWPSRRLSERRPDLQVGRAILGKCKGFARIPRMICRGVAGWRTVCVAALAIVQIACVNSSDPSDVNDVPLGTMRATVDGVPWSSPGIGTRSLNPNAALLLAIVSGDGLPIGLSNTPAFALSFSVEPRVGATTFATSSVAFASFVSFAGFVPAGSWGAAGTTGSGSVTVTTLTSTHAGGTFAFTLVPVFGATGSRVVTGGAFNVTVASVP